MSETFCFNLSGGDMERYPPSPFHRIGPYKCFLSEPTAVSLFTHAIIIVFFPITPDGTLDASLEVKFVPLLRRETFHSVQQRLCLAKDVEFGCVDLVQMPGDRDVSIHDTLESLSYCFTNYFLAYMSPSHRFTTPGVKGSGDIKITCKCRLDRKTHYYKMHDHQPLEILMKYCSNDLNCPIEALTFHYNKKFIEPHHTCSALGITNGSTVTIIKLLIPDLTTSIDNNYSMNSGEASSRKKSRKKKREVSVWSPSPSSKRHRKKRRKQSQKHRETRKNSKETKKKRGSRHAKEDTSTGFSTKQQPRKLRPKKAKRTSHTPPGTPPHPVM